MKRVSNVVCFVVLHTFLVLQHAECLDKFRVCVVDGRGGFKRAARYCPTLDKADSKVECVVGMDRLDCLRKISKGIVDFSVFSPEDIVTATNSEVEVLLTNEMRYSQEKYEYEVVAVINDESGIKSKHDLRNKNFCHPGYGYETDWTDILANFLEASIVPQTCNTKLTITENRISATSNYFKQACKAGPWVNDPILDAELKTKYPNLCALCHNPNRCSTNDKYWGRRGPLFCLTDGYGDVSWARLDDVKIHFGITPGAKIMAPDGYSFLCQDGTTMPVRGNEKPCVWVVKPWPVIAARRKRAQEVQDFINSINQHDPEMWESALLSLIETFKQEITPLRPVEPIESFLNNAPGFLSANSFTGCHPPRTVRVCTTTNVANAKCAWMREAATVYGVEPDLDCLRAANITHCMQAISNGAADLVITSADHVATAQKKYNLTTLFYETVTNDNKYITVTVVKSGSSYKTLSDLRGAKACFPKYDGIAWNSVLKYLSDEHLLDSCPYEAGMAEFFGDSCVPDLPKNSSKSLKALCQDYHEGEYGVLRCLEHADVAFLSKNSFEKYFKDPKEISNAKRESFKVLCENEKDDCYLSWAPIGHAMVSKNLSDMAKNDALDVFLQLDNLFGRNYKSVTAPFSLYGSFDGQNNVLFHDATQKLRNVPVYKNTDMMKKEYNSILSSLKECEAAGGANRSTAISISLMLVLSVLLVFR
ncbi:PREDICTED: transferrin [Nicrophorus vespilloides]|uniref:Transferrin n=1 Tax=Nicrophorus vespilloides TaxID=110193 RepID=A0ABM1N9G3_NICVS|nr:PREDICTED: transferrin [Nicrophorus vespilloides]